MVNLSKMIANKIKDKQGEITEDEVSMVYQHCDSLVIIWLFACSVYHATIDQINQKPVCVFDIRRGTWVNQQKTCLLELVRSKCN